MTTGRDARYTVELVVDSSTMDMLVASRVSNISRGGMFIESSQPLPLDREVAVTFRLGPNAAPINVQGRVAWTHDMKKGSIRMLSGNGIRFTDLSPADQGRLEAYLAFLAAGGAPSVGQPAAASGKTLPPMAGGAN